MIPYLKILLWPISLIYGGIMALRNTLYDRAILASTSFDLPVLAVGNLTVGGTGKTPHVEYLLRLLQDRYSVAALSRGYKRKSSGFLLADEKATAAALGDEPFQYYRDFEKVAVAVSEDRVKGIDQLLQRLPKLEVVVLDDALQHRPVAPSLNLLLTDFNRPFYSDFVLPAGLLREFRRGAKRADAVLVSKCPADLSEESRKQVENRLRKYIRSQVPLFFTTYSYGAPVPIGGSAVPQRQVLLLTAIANADPLKDYLASAGYQVLEHLAFPDHHAFTEKDLLKLEQRLESDKYRHVSILTTRKDAVKLTAAELCGRTQRMPLFYMPIEVTFLQQQERFDALVLRHVSERTGRLAGQQGQ